MSALNFGDLEHLLTKSSSEIKARIEKDEAFFVVPKVFEQDKKRHLTLVLQLLIKLNENCAGTEQRIILRKFLNSEWIQALVFVFMTNDPETAELFGHVLTVMLNMLLYIPDNIHETRFLILCRSLKIYYADNNTFKYIEKQLENIIKLAEAEEEAPDYRETQILPTPNELLKKPSKHTKVKRTGAYNSMESYLNVYFRLTKEDFIAPLRKGIQLYLKDKKAKIFDIHIYQNIVVCKCSMSNSASVWKIKFTPKQNQLKKRLIFGSLVIFTNDNFQSISCATVANSDNIANGLLSIKLLHGQLSEGAIMTMVESEAYYEQYRCVLKRLREESFRKIPFQDYIIGAENYISTEPDTVEYLCNYERDGNGPYYDLSCLAKPKYKSYLTCINILEKSHWWNPEYMVLNEMQIYAVRSAMRNDLSLIQGPPGTGKTYVALQIVKVLIANPWFWNSSLKNEPNDGSQSKSTRSPILIFCHTNHALDNILIKILDEFKGDSGDQIKKINMLRFGSRSENAILQAVGILNVRAEWKENKYHSTSTDQILSKAYEAKKNHEKKLEECITKLEHQYHMIEQKVLSALMQTKYANLHDAAKNNLQEEFGDIPPPKSVYVLLCYWFGIRSPQTVKDHIQINTPVVSDTEENRIIEGLDNMEMPTKVDLNRSADQVCRYSGLYPQGKHNEFIKEILEKKVEEIAANYSIKNNDYKKIRWWLFNYMKRQLTKDADEKIVEEIVNGEIEYRKAEDALKKADGQCDLEIMQTMDIIGFTTVAATRYNHMINKLGAKIIICEEAAEVLESHTVSTLTESCQQLILIGDHQQLRPRPASFDVQKMYNLDISLFERLILNGVYSTQLKEQWTMRPEISNFLKNTVYRGMTDHQSVCQRPKIFGFQNNVNFVDYKVRNVNIYEDDGANASKHNKVEADFAIELAYYLVRSGYEANRISIITFYLEQQNLMVNMVQNQNTSLFTLNGLDIQTVDSFKGHQNDIIILSCVSVNDKNNYGHAVTDNIVNVALSRARNAMFIIGDIDLLSKTKHESLLMPNQKHIWKEIRNLAEEQKCLKPGYLEMFCKQHPEYIQKIPINMPEQFMKLFPYGGCNKPCEDKLPCDHLCPWSCHDPKYHHELIQCREQCGKRLKCGHACLLECYRNCEQKCSRNAVETLHCGHRNEYICHEGPSLCHIMVEKRRPCGHNVTIECGRQLQKCDLTVNKIFKCGHIYQYICHVGIVNMQCHLACQKTLACGHKCPQKCSEICSNTCSLMVEKAMPCGHTVTIECGKQPERCVVKVSKKLNCGHTSEYNCHVGPGNMECRSNCKKKLACGHKCRQPCYIDCESKICPVSRVQKTIHCGHKVTIECGTQPGRCEVKVSKKLNCGHTSEYNCHVGLGNMECRSNCKKKLACGHKCRQPCYIDCESKICPVRVQKTIHCGHKVTIECGTQPGRCEVKVSKKLNCGHTSEYICHVGLGNKQCRSNCEKKLVCGHKCQQLCYINCQSKTCPVMVQKTRPCGHLVTNACGRQPKECKVKVSKIRNCGHQNQYSCHVTPSSIPCQLPCNKTLACGHKCPQTCSQKCSEICPVMVETDRPCGHDKVIECGRQHEKCSMTIVRSLLCGHEHKYVCHVGPGNMQCRFNCNNRPPRSCGHKVAHKGCVVQASRQLNCGHTYHSTCEVDGGDIECLVACKKTRVCGHKCTYPCHIACESKLCRVMVEKTKKCGHKVTVQCVRQNELCTICPEWLTKTFHCGHSAIYMAHEAPPSRCEEEICTFLRCGHEKYVECWDDDESCTIM